MRKIYPKSCFLLLQNSFLIFLKILKYFFQFFSKCYPVFFLLLHFCKISFKFFKNYNKIFLYSKYSPKTVSSQFFQSFITTDNNSKLHYNVCKAPSRKLKIFSELHYNFSTTLPVNFRLSR